MSPTLYWIDDTWRGRLAITSRPRGGDWLESEIEGWKKSGVDVVVSLLTPDEGNDLALEEESSLCEAHGIRFLSQSKTAMFRLRILSAETFIRNVSETLESGRHVAIHCRQSIGPSGVLAAALLITKGETAEEAIRRVSSARGLIVPETAEQKQWLSQFSKTISSPRNLALRTST